MNFYFRDEVLPYYGGGTAMARSRAGNDFLYWETMRRAADRGCRMFDFGRSKIGTGAFSFKHNWGFEPRSLHYRFRLKPGQAIPDHNPLNPKYRMFIAAWKRLPLPDGQRAGSVHRPRVGLAMTKPDLLFLTQRLPYPPIKGEKIRPLQILKYLTQWYDVHLGCLIDDPADAQHIDTIRAMCRDVHVATLDRKIARLTCLRGLLTGESLSVTFFRDRGLARWVRDVVGNVRPAVIFVNSGNMAPYVLDLPKQQTRIVRSGGRGFREVACLRRDHFRPDAPGLPP